MLNEYKDDINKLINDAMKEVEKGYKYCPQCKEYYKDRAWEKEDKQEMREVCIYVDPVEWQDNEYENKKCSISYSICPMGHMIEENVSY